MLANLWVICGLLGLALVDLPPAGGGPVVVEPGPCLGELERQELRQTVAKKQAELQAQGKLKFLKVDPPRFIEPLANGNLATDNFRWNIINYVDLDARFPNRIRDYTGGNRSYDLASGYNHKGIDLVLFPFPWAKMDADAVHIVAAAAGTITAKYDGNPDRNCGFGGNPYWNIVVVTHDDGSQSWYGHMKRDTLTTKAIGDRVAEGEYLGVVGSSGSSYTPHLHFEVYDRLGRLIEPFAGPANHLNQESWWQNQEPYMVSRVNAIYTHSDIPRPVGCYGVEKFNPENHFQAGAPVYVAAYYRDLVRNQPSQFKITGPNGEEKEAWNFSQNNTNFIPGAYYYWRFDNTQDWSPGVYTVNLEFLDTTTQHYFTVGSLGAPNIEQFSAKRSVITPGEETTLSWRTSNADEVWLEGETSYRPLSGSMAVSPSQTTEYKINARGPEGVTTQKVIIEVSGEPEPRMMTHVTPNTDFLTDFVLINLDDAPVDYIFEPFAMDGTPLESVSGQIAPGVSLFRTTQQVFGARPVSHFKVLGPDGLQVTASYRAAGGGSPAHVRERARSASAWRILPGDWDYVWDGFAAINLGDQPANITVRQYSGEGELIGEVADFNTAQPNEKILGVFSAMGFVAQDDAYFLVTSNQPLNIMALRGQLGDSQFLWENDAIMEPAP